MMAAAQALDMRGHKPGKGVTAAREVIRRYVDYLGEDRPLFSDHTRMAELVQSCEILDAVEAEVGALS